MEYLASRGQLKHRVAEHQLWSRGTTPKIEQQDNTIQINIITLKCYLAERALEYALDEQITDIKKICDRANALLLTEFSSAKQFVRVCNGYIQVGIDCNLIDNDVIMLALNMVAELPSFEVGTTIEIGNMVQVYENNISSRKPTHRRFTSHTTNCREK